MKSDAHLYICQEPLLGHPALLTLCRKAIPRAEAVPSWDAVPVNCKLDPEQLLGICAKCVRVLKETSLDGKHLLYAVRPEQLHER